jgi:putative tryptophan/tyrosine transport system substrate-binding protein
MRRREFITLLGSAAAAWPFAARAQQPPVPVVGWLTIRSSPLAHTIAAFRDGLRERGYVEGSNVSTEFRYAAGRYDRVPVLAAELVARRVNVIVATGSDLALAAKAATSTIPIVFSVGSDPVAIGLVASFNRPGGNLTGYTIISRDLVAKRLELLREVIPSAAAVGLLVNPSNPYSEVEMKEVQDAARSLGVQLHIVTASSESDFGPAFTALARQRVVGLLMSGDPFLLARDEQLVALAARHRLPAIYAYRESVAAGGLMSYGASLAVQWRSLGVYVGRILKGERPADLPVIQPGKFELVLNLKTAKTLGLDVPWFLQQRPDEVIE